jgi:hypothetical protein
MKPYVTIPLQNPNVNAMPIVRLKSSASTKLYRDIDIQRFAVSPFDIFSSIAQYRRLCHIGGYVHSKFTIGGPLKPILIDGE